MRNYLKIQGLYKRDMDKKSLRYGKFLVGQYSIPEFEMLKDITWVFSEKLNGMCTCIHWYSHPLVQEIAFQGKTDKAEMPKLLLSRLNELFTKQKMIDVFGVGEDKPDIKLIGEGVGFHIQKNGQLYVNNEKRCEFVLFDIQVGGVWLKREDIEKIANQLGIKIVPIVGKGTIDEAITLVTNGFVSDYGNFLAEGVVIRPIYELKTRMGQRIVTKIKSCDFLEK